MIEPFYKISIELKNSKKSVVKIPIRYFLSDDFIKLRYIDGSTDIYSTKYYHIASVERNN